jgi:hypothetical protein
MGRCNICKKMYKREDLEEITTGYGMHQQTQKYCEKCADTIYNAQYDYEMRQDEYEKDILDEYENG